RRTSNQTPTGILYMVKQYTRVAVDAGAANKPWRPSRNLLIALGVIAGLSLVPYPYEPSGDFEVLPRNRADVRALAAGDIREVLVKEGDIVKAGQAIARLDTSAQKARVAGAEAEIAGLQADLALAKKGARPEEIAVAKQRVATARSAANNAESSFKRIATAYRGKGVTPQEYERAKGAADVAKQQLLEAERSLALIASPVQQERIDAIQASIERAQAELTYAQQDLAYGTITAPIDGRIVSSQLQFARGQYFARGDLLATIEDTGELLGEIKMPEEAIGDVKVDAAASIKPWAYPNTSFDGRVKAVAPAAEDGEYGKVVRVQVVLEDPQGKLKTGMTGSAKVDGGWHLTIVVFTRAIARFLFVELWSWIP
ncbi:MAG TPA: efflux RND transporter periplasmic adaptor subunit, partial [Nevskiaceae bacterium]|nr:efflux RND transporter periplasmic adaptor subunit [Nevskiaceae bacterium]